jgi:tetratricopeptide (TPR) repeat protein
MPTIKNRFPRGLDLFLISGLVFIFGCTPPGPRALLKGEKLIQEGKWEQAVLTLQEATQLLPNNAQAWNHLGIAYHGNNQPELALKCYRTALSLDRNLAATRYNLGCLLLEQNDFAGASEQLTSFTFLQPSSPTGWVKLGVAHLRNRKFDLAEKSFKTALELHPNDPEILNDIGLIHLQRKRPQEAIAYFNIALDHNTNYGPALLNLGIVNQQNPNTRHQALQHYKRYLALQPKPAEFDKVQALASQLEMELNPAPVQVSPVAHAAPPAKTNPSAMVSNSSPATSRSSVAVAAARSNSVNLAVTNPPKTSHVAAVAPPATAVEATNKPPAVEAPKNPPATSELEVTQVPNDFVIKPVQEVAASNPGNTTAAQPPTVSNSDANTTAKPGLFSKLNPFVAKTKPGEKSGPAPASSASPEIGTATPVVTPEAPPIPRYTYATPIRPVSGNRKEAERYFSEGLRLHKAGQLAQAVAYYQRATQLDPAYFEAFYNQGLASYDLGRFKQSLPVYEYALALQPDSADARYNFSLALKQAGYPADAAAELAKILSAHPDEARSHYSLGNLCAHQLKQPREAREHYQKVLALQPNHPRASEIRYWLAANP